MDNKFESLEELADAMRALPINWNRLSEFSIVWENHQKRTNENGDPEFVQKPNVRLKFADQKEEPE